MPKKISTTHNENIEVAQKEKLPSLKAQSRKINAVGKPNVEKLLCVGHNKMLVKSSENFYMTNSGSLYSSIGLIPICKTCIRKIYMDYLYSNKKDVSRAIFLTCRKLDIRFDFNNCNGAIERSKGDLEGAFGWYVQINNSLKQNSGVSSNFDVSDTLEKEKSIEDQYNNIISAVKLNSEDKRNVKDIIKRIGQNPFENSGMSDQQLSQVYSELVGYLSDDDIATDPYRLRVVLQVIQTNSQIAQIDLYLSLLTSNLTSISDSISLVSTLTTQKSKLVDSNMKLLKENRWISEDAMGKSKLANLFKKYRDYGFTEVEVNYFDALIAPAVRTVLDLSHQSIIETIDFGEQEMNQVFAFQRELIDTKDKEISVLHNEKVELARELVDYKTKNAVSPNGK